MMSPSQDTQRESRQIISYHTVRDAIDAARADDNTGIAVLIIGLEDCRSCSSLRDDMARIAMDTLGLEVYYGSLMFESGEEDYAAINQLGVSNFPTALVYERGNLLHGWVGYNDQLSWGERSEALSGLLRSAIERAAPRRVYRHVQADEPALTRGEVGYAKQA
ncbi:MAG: hypothetical protein C0474_03185 [Sphingobium sp.]|jgi:hypothetical protein|nr:hypothetical protein [Sphingobium sp.]